MRSARTSRRQVAGDQRHSRLVQSSTRRTASGAAAGSPQSRRSRSQAKPFRASSQSAGAPGALPRRVVRFGRHGARAAAGQKLAHEQALADRRIARPGVGRHGEEALGRAVAQGQGIEAGGEQPAAEFAALAGRRLGRAGGGTERMGRAPAVKGSPDRRMSEATSVIFSVLFGPMAHPPAGRGVGGVYPTRTAVAMPPERPKPAAGRP